MKKEFIFSAKFDTSEFDKSIGEMQKKLKAAYSPAEVAYQNQQTSAKLAQAGMGGILTAPSMEAFQKATQSSRREMDALISTQAKGQEELGKQLVKRAELLKKLQSQQKDMVKGSEDELKIKEKIARVEENSQRLRESYKQRDAAINQALEAKEALRPKTMDILRTAGRGDFKGAASDAMESIRGGINGIGGSAAGVAGAVGVGLKAVQFGSKMYEEYNRMPLDVASSQGSAISNVLAPQVNNIYGRRTGIEAMYAPERAKASEMAKQAMEARKNSDTVNSTLALTAMGAAGGALAGGIPTAGIGAGPGALVGGGAGLGVGALRFMTDERARTKDLSMLPDWAGGKKYKEKYESMNAEDFAKDYAKATEDLKAQNPFKTAATQEYSQNMMRDLEAQRSMGMDNEQFRGKGGYLEKIMDARFTPEMGLGMSSSIRGAGGSTSSMSGNSALGLQMQRGMNLSNAGQVLGTLSSSIGGDKATEQATIRIMAEGMKLGLDSSKFAEENSRFVQATADIIAKSGARGEGDIERTAKNFGKFLGENTNKGIEAAQTSYDEYQNRSKQMGGSTGVMQFAGMMKDKDLKNLSTIDKQAFGQMDEKDINASNPLAVGLAKKLKISVDDLAAKKTELTEGTSSRFREFDTARDTLKKSGVTMDQALDPEKRAKFTPEQEKAFTDMLAMQQVEKGNTGVQNMISRGSRELGGRPAVVPQNAAENVITDRLNRDTGKVEDKSVGSMARDSKIILDNFNEMAPAFAKAADSTAKAARKVREAAAEVDEALRLKDTPRLQKALESLNRVQNQPHGSGGAGKSSGGSGSW